ncbi:MAG: elongation factor P [Spirochaetales bacterium]|nr:elongation factor P [Spirochaetales bacterium]
MIKAGNMAKGGYILFKGEPHLIAEREFVNPGKGSAFVRVKLKNLKNGLVVQQTIKSQENVDDVEVLTRNQQFLYEDAESYVFMDNDDYEQYHVAKEGAEDLKYYLREGEVFQVEIYENAPVNVKLPLKMSFEVTEANEGLKGDTVTGATKAVTLSTGLVVRVPLFIKQGDKVIINTETNDYVERDNK